MDSRLPIGVFDSGVGGLTVLRAIHERLPDERLLYLGDTARLPYGTKSPASVQRYALHAAEYLVRRGIKLLVVACNTASAVALDTLREELAPLPVIGVVNPGAAAAVAISKAHRYIVLATESTSRRRAYTDAIRALQGDAEVEELPCSLFVALAEEGWQESEIADAIAEKYLGALRDRDSASRPDAAILGCTHFPLMASSIGKALGPDIFIIDSAATTAEAVADELGAGGLANRQAGNENLVRLIATDGPARFARVGGAFLGQEFTEQDIELIDIHPADLAGDQR